MRSGDRGDDVAPLGWRQRARHRAGTGVHYHERLTPRHLGLRVLVKPTVAEVDRQSVVGDRGEPQRLGDEQPTPDLVHVRIARYPSVEEGTGVVMADSSDLRHAGPAQQQGQRQRALVRRDQHGGVADAQFADPTDEGRSVALPDGHGVGLDPWHRLLDHRRDAREHVGCGPAPGTAQQVHWTPRRRCRSHRRSGQ